ncbi:MAG: pilus assembly protein TadG-related protein [Terriglobia bacterium]|jgi:Flp pilus assembly protein TadG
MATHRNDSGQTLALVGLAMPVLLGFLGLGIDMGYMRYVKRQVQMAADAAAIAGANEITSCTKATGSDCPALTTAAKTAVSGDNSFPSVTQSTGCSPAPAKGATVVLVNNPPSCITTDPHFGNDSYVETIVAENVPTLFSTILGINSATISARAEGAIAGGGNCVYALDPNNTSLNVAALAVVVSNCGVVVESSSSDAFNCFFSDYSAPVTELNPNGGDSWFCLGSPNFKPTPVPQPADPLAYKQAELEAAAQAADGTTCTGHSGGPLVITSKVTLNPGTYCGGIYIGFGANVTFNPGIYTLTSTSASNGGLTIGVDASVTGDGVAFYNSDLRNGSVVAGNNGGINFLCSSCTAGNVTLTAPTSGPYEGILFFQDPGNTSSSQVFGSAFFNTRITGTTYLPSASVLYAFDLQVDYNDVVAKDITYGLTLNGTLIANTTQYSNYSTLADGSPIKAGSGALVE